MQYIVLLFLLLTTACSPKDESSSSFDYQNNFSTTLSYESSPDNIDFGVVENNSDTKAVKIFNISSEPVVLSSPIVSHSNFLIVMNQCNRPLAPGKNCSIFLRFKSLGLNPGVILNEQLIVNDLTIPLLATTNNNVSQLMISSSNIDFGPVLKGLRSDKVIKITNKTLVSNSLNISPPSVVKVLTSSCPLSLNPGQSCSLRISLNTNTIPVGTITDSFTINNQLVSIQGEVLPAVQGQAQLMAETVSLNNIPKNTKVNVLMKIYNQGNAASPAISPNLPPGVLLLTNSCSSGINPGQSCYLRLRNDTSFLNLGPNSQIIGIGATQGQINTSVVSPQGATQLALEYTDSNLLNNTCSNEIALSLKDNNGDLHVAGSSRIITISKDSGLKFYIDNNCQTEIQEINLQPLESSKIVYLKTHNSIGNKGFTFNYESLSNSGSIFSYDILSSTLANDELIINTNKNYSYSGGLSPVTFSIQSGGGEISATGNFSSSQAGLNVVKISDAAGQEFLINIQVFDNLTVTDTFFEKAVNQSYQVLPLGGKPPYTYEKNSGVGTINNSGLYSAGNTAGLVSLKIKDALNQEVNISGQIYSLLNLNQSAIILAVNNSFNFSASGGKPPYTFSKITGSGSINSATGAYIAGGIPGSDQIKVVDILGQEALANITVNAPVTLSAGTCNTSPLLAYKPCTLSVSGGVGTISLSTDKGSVNSTTRELIPNCTNNLGNTTITAQDSYGNSTSLNLNVSCVYSGCSEIKAKGYALTNGEFWVDMDGYETYNAFQAYCDITDNSYTEIFDLVRQPSISSTDALNKMNMYSNLPLASGQVVKDSNGVYWKNTSGIQGLSYSLNKFPIGAVKIRVNRVLDTNANQGGLSVHSINKNNCSSDWGAGASSCVNNILKGTYHSTLNVLNYVDGNVGSSNWSVDNLTGLTTYSTAQNLEHILTDIPSSGIFITSYGRTEGASNTQTIFHTTQLKFKDIYHHHPRSCAEAKSQNRLNLDNNNGSGVYVLDNDGFELKDPPVNVYCNMSSTGVATLTRSCQDAKRFGQLNANSTLLSGYYNLDLDGVGVGSGTTQSIYCDQETYGGGWALISNSNQSNGSYPATTGLAFTSNFDLQPIFPASIANSNKMVKIKGGALREYVYNNTANQWKAVTDNSKILYGNGTSSGVVFLWTLSDDYSRIYPLLGNPTAGGGWCNGSTGFSVWMNKVGNPGIGIFVGSNAYQGGCNSNVYYSVDFNWQVFSK